MQRPDGYSISFLKLSASRNTTERCIWAYFFEISVYNEIAGLIYFKSASDYSKLFYSIFKEVYEQKVHIITKSKEIN